MKKSLLVLVLVFSMIIFGCGCGNGTDSNTTGDNTSPQQNEADSNDENNIIMFETPLMVVDDDYATVEILSLEKESYNEDGKSGNYGFVQYNVNCRVTNKSDEYYLSTEIHNGDANVGAHTVDFANGDADTRPGKVNDGVYFSATQYIDGTGTHGAENIETLEDLLEFEADMYISLYEDTGTAHLVKNSYNVSISIPELIAAQ